MFSHKEHGVHATKICYNKRYTPHLGLDSVLSIDVHI